MTNYNITGGQQGVVGEHAQVHGNVNQTTGRTSERQADNANTGAVANNEGRGPYRASTWEKVVAVAMAALIVGVVMYLVVRNQPFADPNLVRLLRIVLSVAAGILGATIPGFLDVEWKGGGFIIRAGGALALFVITFFGSPSVILPPPHG